MTGGLSHEGAQGDRRIAGVVGGYGVVHADVNRTRIPRQRMVKQLLLLLLLLKGKGVRHPGPRGSTAGCRTIRGSRPNHAHVSASRGQAESTHGLLLGTCEAAGGLPRLLQVVETARGGVG